MKSKIIFQKEDFITAIELMQEELKERGSIFSLNKDLKPTESLEEYYKIYNKYNKKASNLFFEGGKLDKKKEYNNIRVSSYLKLILSDWDYSHEDKIAIAAQILDYFYE